MHVCVCMGFEKKKKQIKKYIKDKKKSIRLNTIKKKMKKKKSGTFGTFETEKKAAKEQSIIIIINNNQSNQIKIKKIDNCVSVCVYI